ncbi:MAG: hypothetical protein HY525_13310 [Betaproteobacteria bacterium]|nr:hypothetical protein [Betaproteobacteria bacterium]
MLLYGEWVEAHVPAPVPRRQYVFTVPRLLRPVFARHRAARPALDLARPGIASFAATVAHEWHRIFGRTSSPLTDMERVNVPALLVAGAKHVHGCEPPLLSFLLIGVSATSGRTEECGIMRRT